MSADYQNLGVLPGGRPREDAQLQRGRNVHPYSPASVHSRATLDTASETHATPTPPRFRRAVTSAGTPSARTGRTESRSPGAYGRYRIPSSAASSSSIHHAQFGSSVPSTSASFHERWHGRNVTPRVEPQNDYLANWESLADLIIPSPEPGPSGSAPRSPRRVQPSPALIIGGRGLRGASSMLSIGRARARNIPGQLPETDEEDEGDLTFSGVLSSSPPAFDARPSLGEVSDAMSAVSDGDEVHSIPRSITPTQHDYGAIRETPATRQPETPSKPAAAKPPRWTRPPPWVISILKCGLAYLIAELFTFVPQLSELLSMRTETDVHGRIRRVPAYSAHMVATIVVYFNPARTMGNMILSTRYCGILATLAVMVSLISFGIIRLFDYAASSGKGSEWRWVSEMGDWVVCILCIGGSMGGLAWSKQWVGNAAYNTGCSMAAVTLFTVIVKEGGWIKLKEVLLIVAIGATITNFVSYTFMPVSATTRLQDSMSKSLQSFSTLLDILTSTFLLEQPLAKENRMPLADAVKAHGAAFKSLQANLAEAKHERIIDPRVRGTKLELYDAAIGSMARLAQHLAAMRSSTRLQEALLRANNDGRIDLRKAEKHHRHMAASVIYELNDLPTITVEDEEDVESSVGLFMQLQRMTGDNMDSLVTKCDEALDAIEDVITEGATTDLGDIRMDVSAALGAFSKSSSTAIKRIYAGPRRRRGVYDSDGSDSESGSDDLAHLAPPDNEFDDDGPNEVIFLVYFFLFTLEEFARELLFLLATVNDILNAPKFSAMDQLRVIAAPWRRNLRNQQTNFLYKQFQKLVPVDPSKLQPPLFPRNLRDKKGTVLTPRPDNLSLRGKFFNWVWTLGARLREPDMKYAVKTGLGGAILAAPAFAESTRATFLEYRGEWALIAYFATMSPTLGQTNFLSFFRITGTILGGTVAVIACLLFPENPIILPIFGFLFSLPCFYIITQMPDYAQAGRFILLTYNLTCLYTYNLRESDLSPVTIAFKRSASVIVGVVWAALVSRYWWPYTARRELRMGLGDFCLDLSYLYSKLVTTYTKGSDDVVAPANGETTDSTNERTPLLPLSSARHHLGDGVRQFMAMELHLQAQLGQLRGLLAHAKNEPRLKGPFPFDLYHEVLLSCERMLDRLHSMRCVTTRMEWDNSIREAFVLPVNHLQREMAGSIILYFYTLSAGFRLRIPMPPYLPPAEVARVRLVNAIRDLDVVKRRSVRGGGRHLLFFAYALAMQEVIAELDLLGTLLQEAFGVISQGSVRDFEALFQVQNRTLHNT